VGIGFFEPNSHRLVDVTECPVLVPELVELLRPMREHLAAVLATGEQAELHVTSTDTGIDVSLRLARRRTPDLLMQLAAMANNLRLARLCWNGELIALNRTPVLQIAGIPVAVPPESFLQPSKAAEGQLQSLALESANGAREIADLFCGCGTFALSLASRASIVAIDSSAAQIQALGQAVRAQKMRVKVDQRDLFRRPLSSDEMARFDAVVLDPPRVGAIAQCRELAAARVASLLYVSCNPASFGRDARILCDAGYRLTRVVPVDQFLWSPHVELFAHFTR
jgi:23S rRNA (uracil1939-C5)-methyltransferase